LNLFLKTKLNVSSKLTKWNQVLFFTCHKQFERHKGGQKEFLIKRSAWEKMPITWENKIKNILLKKEKKKDSCH